MTVAAPSLGLRRFAVNLSLYAGVRLLDRAVGFLIVPIVALYIGGAAAYGVKEYVEVLVALASLLAGAQIGQSVVRHLSGRVAGVERVEAIAAALLFVLAGGAVLAGAAIVWAAPIAQLLLGDRAFADAIACAGAIVLFNGLANLGFAVLEADGQARRYAALWLGKLAMEVGLKLVLLVQFGLGYMAVLYAALAGNAAFGLIVAGLALRGGRAPPSLLALRRLLAYSLPILPVSLCMLGVHQIDRMMLAELAGLDATGVYGVGWKFGAAVGAVLLSAFGTAWFPAVFAIADPARRRRFVSATSSLFLAGAGAATLLVMALAPLATALLPPEYESARGVIQVVAFGHMFWFLYQTVSIPIFTAMRTTALFKVAVLGLALNVLLNLWTIPLYGALGAAYATALTYAALAVAVDVVARRIDADAGAERWRLLGLIAWLLACFGAWAAARPAGAGPALDLLAAGVVLALYAAGLAPLRLIDRSALEEFVGWRSAGARTFSR